MAVAGERGMLRCNVAVKSRKHREPALLIVLEPLRYSLSPNQFEQVELRGRWNGPRADQRNMGPGPQGAAVPAAANLQLWHS